MAKLRPRQDSPVARLTPRLQEVLRLIAQGYNNAAIAERLVLSKRSVEGYVKSIYQELHLSPPIPLYQEVVSHLNLNQQSR